MLSDLDKKPGKVSASLLGNQLSRHATTIEDEVNKAENDESIFLPEKLYLQLSFTSILWRSFKFFALRIYPWTIICAVVISIGSIILVSIPFGVAPYYNHKHDIKNMYWDYNLVLFGTNLPLNIIIIIIASAIVSALLKTWRWYDILVIVPILIVTLVSITMFIVLFFDIHLYWYGLEVVIVWLLYVIAAISVAYYIIKVRGMHIFSFKQIVKYSLLPMFLCILAINVAFQSLNAVYIESSILYKILIRGILWPLFGNIMLILAEYWSYHVGKVTRRRIHELEPIGSVNNNEDINEELVDIERRNHGLYNVQIGFLLIGRVWISYIENVQDVVIICIIQAIWDIFIHRTSRPLNMFLTSICLKHTKGRSLGNRFLLKCRAAFNNEKLLLYRAVIINAEYTADTCCIITNAVFIIALIVTQHWHYNNLIWNIPNITVSNMIIFAVIQLTFNMVTHVVTGAFDIKYGRINLLFPWRRRIWKQYLSELNAFIGMSLFGSYYLYRQLPNYIQCTNSHDVCSCDFADAKFGC